MVRPSGSATAPVSDWVASLAATTVDELDGRERTALEVLVVDALGIAAAGRDGPGVAEALAALEGNAGTGPVRLPWTRADLPAPVAAAALSALIHAWDFDDTHDSAVVHTACIALPASLAAALVGVRTGADVAAGIAVGVQTLVRLSGAVGGRRGTIRTASLGALGAAAAAGRALGLDAERLTSALGLALSASGSPMTRQVVAEGSPAKRLQPLFAVQAGVTAALLASRGVYGPHDWFDGEYGVLALREDGDREAGLAGLGKPGWEVAELSLKPYPACRYTHAAIHAVRDLADGASTSPAPVSEIADVVVHVPAGQAYALVSRPFEWRGQPVADVQFSVPWLVAAMLRTGRVDLSSLRSPVLDDPAIEELAGRIRVVQDMAEGVAMAPADVEVTYRDGRVVRRHAPMPGSPADPLTLADVEAKVSTCLPDAGAATWISTFSTGLPGLDADQLREALSAIDPQEN